MIEQYTLKPIEAIFFDGTNHKEVIEYLGEGEYNEKEKVIVLTWVNKWANKVDEKHNVKHYICWRTYVVKLPKNTNIEYLPQFPMCYTKEDFENKYQKA